MAVDGTDFRDSVTAIIRERHPKRIIESGTYIGLGSTKIVADALGDDYYKFFTIESNPAAYAEACNNLQKYPNIRVCSGYSVPRNMLPSRDEVIAWLDALKNEDVYVDFQEHERVACYMREVGWQVPDDLLRICLRAFGYCADLIVLDSSGHLGLIEFTYVLSLLRSPCIFVLDDTKHVKHFQSLARIKADSQFNLIKESDEKFGFCIAEWRGHVR
jgi:hypothetical protein